MSSTDLDLLREFFRALCQPFDQVGLGIRLLPSLFQFLATFINIDHTLLKHLIQSWLKVGADKSVEILPA